MSPILAVFIAVFGAVIGSFLSAVLWRLRTGESFVLGRSYCVFCRHALAAADLVPVASFLLLRGRCRYCRKPIDPQYLLLELATALLFVLAAIKDVRGADVTGADFAQLFLHWYEIAVLELVFVYDLRYMLVLPIVTVPATFIGGLGAVALGVSPWKVVLGAAVGAGVFLLQHLLSRGAWVGSGDAYIGVMLGAILGWPGVLLALFLAYVSGAIAGLGLIATGRATRKSRVPFGTFLAGSTVAVLLWGDGLLSWYFSRLL